MHSTTSLGNGIQPLQLGSKIFPVNLIQGPLAGVSCAPFRYLTWKYGQPAFSCTEMISCKTLIYQSKAFHHRFVSKDPEEGPVCFQLAGSDPAEIGLATRIVSDYGADLIDLNCGCPVKKIRSRGAGSRLLVEPGTLFKLITAMKQNTTVPISIKIRVEGNSDEGFNAQIARVVQEAGADFLVVHGRHWTEGYETRCRYDQIQFFVENLKIPVIGNGDIAGIDSLKTMFATGCAGVMISRAGVGQPWLTRQLVAEMKNECFVAPSPQIMGWIFINHVEKLIRLMPGAEKMAIFQARKLAKYYAKPLATKNAFCEAIHACDNFAAFKAICYSHFDLAYVPLPDQVRERDVGVGVCSFFEFRASD